MFSELLNKRKKLDDETKEEAEMSIEAPQTIIPHKPLSTRPKAPRLTKGGQPTASSQ